MNKKLLFDGAIFLTVTITIIILLNRAATRTLPGSQQIAQTQTAAATAGPKEEAESAQATLTGITSIPSRPQALLRVKWPARGLIHDRADMGHGEIGVPADFQVERLALAEYNNRQSYE